MALLSSSGDLNAPCGRPTVHGPPFKFGRLHRAVWPPPSTRPFFQAQESSTHPRLQEPYCDDVHVIFVLTCYPPFVTIFFGSIYFSFFLPHLPYSFCCVCVHLEYFSLSSTFLIVCFATFSMTSSNVSVLFSVSFIVCFSSYFECYGRAIFSRETRKMCPER